MIVVDIETSGGDFEKCGIIEIGAVDLENTDNIFFEKARLSEEYEIVNAKGFEKTVLEVLGTTEKDLRNKDIQSEELLLKHFFEWCLKVKIKNFICQNPQFDYSFIWRKAVKYNLDLPVDYKVFDLHSVAQVIYFNINGKFLMEEKTDGNFSNMGLKNILSFVGMQDPRKNHNGLEDAMLEAECFSRLVYGKNLLPKYSKFKIPDYLKK